MSAQRGLEDLVDPDDDGLALVAAWAGESPHPVEIVPGDPSAGRNVLLALQVTTRSVLGAVAFHCGGLRVDHGWLRHLGSGDERVASSIVAWNAMLGGNALDPSLDGALVVAYDVLGGIFAINAGALEGASGAMHYYAPDGRAWEPLEMGHAQFVSWILSDRLDVFYAGWRWSGWQADVAGLGPDEGFAVYPPLGFAGSDGEPITMDARTRSVVPIRQLWLGSHLLERQLGGVPDGSTVEFRIEPGG